MAADPNQTLDDAAAQAKSAVVAWQGPNKPTPPPEPSLADVADLAHKAINDRKQAIASQRAVRMNLPIIPKSPSDVVTSTAMGMVAGFVKGLASPVSSFLSDQFSDKLDAWEEDAVRKQLGMMAKSDNASTFAANPRVSRFLAGAPSGAAELAGGLVPLIPGYEAAKSVLDVDKAVTLAGKAGRSILAASATGGLFSAAARLEPGESRWSKVATDAAAMGAFELVGVPAMMKALKEESPGLTEAVAKEMNIAPEVAEQHLTAVRAGIAADPDVVEKVLDVAKSDPVVAQQPVVLQAAKQSIARGKIASPKSVIDPLIGQDDPNFAGRIIFNVEGQSIPQDITRDPKNPSSVSDQIKAAKAQLLQLVNNGANVSFDSITAGSQEDVNNILAEFTGKTKKTPNLDKRKRGVPGAAPKNSVAENGPLPQAGSTVTVAEPDKPQVQGIVKAVGGTADDIALAAMRQPPQKTMTKAEAKADAFARAAEASTVSVEMPDKSIRSVPLAHVQVPLEVGVKPTMDLNPQVDGSTRHAIVHLDDKTVSFEPLGASQEQDQNYFRGPMFSSTSEDTQWGKDPRLFIDKDGLKLSVVKSDEEGVNLVTAKRAARTLLDNGVAGDSPITVHLAAGEHSVDTPQLGQYNVRDLAEAKLPLADMSRLQDDAAARGLTAAPWGDQVTLKSKNGFSRTFANSVEAHEAILRMPEARSGVKIEAELERQWKMGSERAWDPDVDVTKYLPIEQYDAGVKELAEGKRPMVPVYTKDPKALTDTVHQLETQMGMPADTFSVKMLPAMDSADRSAAVIYNRGMVATQAAKYRDSLRFLGIESKDPDVIFDGLSKRGKGHGIYVLSGRDGESAALYAKWREDGAKELWEKGRVENDTLGPYRRYSKAAKQVITYPGAGDEQYVAKDLGDSFTPPEGVKFAADSGEKPRAAEEMAPHEPFGPGKPPTGWSITSEGKPRFTPPEGDFYDVSGPMSKTIGNRIRPMMELSKDLTARTGVPYYDWWHRLDVARNVVEQKTNPFLAQVRDIAKPLSRLERQQVQQLFEARISSFTGTAALEGRVSAGVKAAADAITAVYTKVFENEGFKQKDISKFFGIFPELRKADGDFRYALKGKSEIPRIGQLLSKELQNGTINIDSRELDFQRVANRIIRSTITERHLQPEWDRVATELQAYSEAKRVPADYAKIFTTHMQEILHVPDALHQSLARAMTQVFAKFGGRLSEIESQDAVSMLTQMNYFSNLGWQPGQVLRNFMQTLQTSLPIIGTGDTLAGWRYGMKWWKDAAIQKEMVEKGIIQPGAIYEPLQEVQRLIEGGGGKVNKALDVFFNQGTRWHTNAFDFNKVVAYRGQYERALRFGQQYAEGKINWAEFLEKSKADMRDTKGGPFLQELKGIADTGDVEKLATRLGQEFSKSTQFVYTRGNAPYAMQSTGGRFLFQYGTWPAWYGENLRNMLMRGSPRNKALAFGRWLGVQSAMFGTANALFGVDLARWTFFSPLGYQGGPFLQMGMQADQTWRSIVDPSSNDPVARIAKARLAGSLIRQVTPLPIGAGTNILKAVQDLNGGAWQDSARQVLGLPPAKGSILP